MDGDVEPDPQIIESKYDKDVAEALDILSGLKRRIDIKKGQLKNLPEFEKLIQRIPSDEEMINALLKVRGLFNDAIIARKGQLSSGFDGTWATYITEMKASGRPFEQLDRGLIRVGRLSMEADSNRFAVRALFNEEVVLGWKTIVQPDEIVEMENDALARIERKSLRQDEFQQLLLVSVQELSSKMRSEMKLIRMVDIYRQIPLQMVLRQISNQKNVKMSGIDYPYSSFLYDLDLYKENMDGLPQNMQLIFHTGGQAETTRIGVVMGSGAVNQPYKKFCFVSLR
jgi:hypothetical protein